MQSDIACNNTLRASTSRRNTMQAEMKMAAAWLRRRARSPYCRDRAGGRKKGSAGLQSTLDSKHSHRHGFWNDNLRCGISGLMIDCHGKWQATLWLRNLI